MGEFTHYKQRASKKHLSFLKEFRKNTKNASLQQPLSGFRIALDPGHFSSERGAEKTGKYVKLLDGRQLSEGDLNLQLALLLADSLTKLGAEVLITTNNFEPPAKFNKTTDLASRADTINKFKPQLTLILHFDAHDTTSLQLRANDTRAYVYGNLGERALASKKSLSTAMQALADAPRWIESNVFSAAIVKNVADSTKLNLKTEPKDFGGMKIANGVYARDLALPKLINEGAVCYLEALHYNHKKEFLKLIKQDRTANLFGFKFHYSSRMDEIATGITQGVLDYVRNR